jgi:DNA-binding CsgD family transcriptional regulator
MARLSPVDFQAALDFLREIEAVDELGAFPARALAGLEKLIPCDILSYNELELRQRRVLAISRPNGVFTADNFATFERLAPQNPLISHYARTSDGRPLKISDFVSQRQFHRLELFQELYRHVGAEYQLAVTIPSPPSIVIGIAFNRQRRDFTERERDLLTVVRPHLAYAYKTIAARTRICAVRSGLERALEANDRAIVLIGPERRVTFATSRASEWFGFYLGCPLRGGSRLPDVLHGWVRYQSVCLNNELPTRPNDDPLVFQREGRRLLVRFLPHGEVGAEDTLLLEERHDSPPTSAPGARLTRREAGVLGLVAQGKTNRQIASTLVVSDRTVQKHLEHIYDKLGVRTRTAAALTLLGESIR